MVFDLIKTQKILAPMKSDCKYFAVQCINLETSVKEQIHIPFFTMSTNPSDSNNATL